MKKILGLICIIAFLSSCTKEKNSENFEVNVHELTTSTSKNIDVTVLEEDRFDHNTRLQNLIDGIVELNCKHTPRQVDSLLNDEFAYEYSMLENHKYIELYTNSVYMRMAVRVLYHWFYYSKDKDISMFPQIVQDYVNEVYNTVPSELRSTMKSNYFDIQSGEINGANYVLKLNNRCDSLLSLLSQDHHMAIEVYRKTIISSFEFWSNTNDGGLGGFDAYFDCLKHDENIWGGGVFKMNDNDWPNEATCPKWLDNDCIGGIGGFFTGGLLGYAVGTICGSVMT